MRMLLNCGRPGRLSLEEDFHEMESPMLIAANTGIVVIESRIFAAISRPPFANCSVAEYWTASLSASMADGPADMSFLKVPCLLSC